MTNRPECIVQDCGVQITPDQRLCAGHIFLNLKERRKSEEFTRWSKDLLARIKASADKEAGR